MSRRVTENRRLERRGRVDSVLERLRSLASSIEETYCQYREIERLLSQSRDNVKRAPHLACTNNGIILERFLRQEVEEKKIPEKSGKPALQQLLADVTEARRKAGKSGIPARVRRKIGEVQKLRNQGAHDTADPCTQRDAEESLDAICEVIDWFLGERAGGNRARSRSWLERLFSWLRRRPKRIAAIAALVLVAIVFFLWDSSGGKGEPGPFIVLDVDGVRIEIYGDQTELSPEVLDVLAVMLGSPDPESGVEHADRPWWRRWFRADPEIHGVVTPSFWWLSLIQEDQERFTESLDRMPAEFAEGHLRFLEADIEIRFSDGWESLQNRSVADLREAIEARLKYVEQDSSPRFRR